MDEINIESSFVMDLAKELISMVSGIVVKREDIANRYETIDTLKAYDQYSDAIKGVDEFESYDKYDSDLLEQAGLTQLEISKALLSKKNIPIGKRDAVLVLQRQKIIDEFVEQNNYYRMLNGKPFTDDTLEIFILETVAGVDTSKPVHLMTNDEIFILNNEGYIDSIMQKYPDRAYIKFLGSNKIDVVAAREARKFDILKLGFSTNADIENRFYLNYERSKTYILNNYYKRRFSIDQTYFDAYIGFIIVVNALVITINDSVDIYNSKEFVNELTIKAFLQSHNLDIFDDVPFIYRKKIADNIKSLIVSKSTDEVIFKIFKIFGFDNITVRKFILVKEHLKDIDENYIFSYESDGVTPKYSDMYDVHFAQVDINSPNIDSEIRRPENKIAYSEVVSKDIYWGGYESDEDVRLKLLQEDFNYINTDYININTAYEMSKLAFEYSYFISMTLDLKTSLEKLTLTDPFLSQEVTLFYSITMLSYLLARKAGFNGEIITAPEDIAVINKFNFDRSLTTINDILKKYNYTPPKSFATILPSGQLTDPSELVDLYFKNKDIYDTLMQIKSTTRNLNEYLACKEILEYIAQSKLLSTIYKKPDGNIATTYYDYLLAKNQVLASYLESLDDTLIDSTIFKILSSLEEFIHTNKFLYVFLKIPTLSSENALKTYMLKLINIFKAFTINVFSMTITYSIEDITNNIKILDSKKFEGHRFNHDHMLLTDSLGIKGNKTVESSFRFWDELELINSKGGSSL